MTFLLNLWCNSVSFPSGIFHLKCKTPEIEWNVTGENSQLVGAGDRIDPKLLIPQAKHDFLWGMGGGSCGSLSALGFGVGSRSHAGRTRGAAHVVSGRRGVCMWAPAHAGVGTLLELRLMGSSSSCFILSSFFLCRSAAVWRRGHSLLSARMISRADLYGFHLGIYFRGMWPVVSQEDFGSIFLEVGGLLWACSIYLGRLGE